MTEAFQEEIFAGGIFYTGPANLTITRNYFNLFASHRANQEVIHMKQAEWCLPDDELTQYYEVSENEFQTLFLDPPSLWRVQVLSDFPVASASTG